MAMTKAERAEMERLRRELELALALRWSGRVEPARLEPPTKSGEWVNGWQFNEHRDASEAVYPVWTGITMHGRGHLSGPRRWDQPASQNAIRPFATKLDAAIALRLAVERQCAERLAAIDALIEEARG